MKILLLNLLFIYSLYPIACRRIVPHEKNEIPEWFLQFNALEQYYKPRFGSQILKWQLLFSVLPHELQKEIVASLEKPDFIDHVHMIKRMYFYSFCGNPRLRKLLVQAIEDRITEIDAMKESYKREVKNILLKKIKVIIENSKFFLGCDVIEIVDSCKRIIHNKHID